MAREKVCPQGWTMVEKRCHLGRRCVYEGVEISKLVSTIGILIINSYYW